MRHQPVKGSARAALQLRNELGFVPGPGEDARQVRHGYRLSRLSALSNPAGESLRALRAICGRL